MENVVELTEEQKAADDYRAMLSQKVMRVVFNKKDGTERVLIGTTNHDIIQEAMGDDVSWRPPEPTKYDSPKPPSTNVVVFDLEILQWRAFNSTKLISMTDKV